MTRAGTAPDVSSTPDLRRQELIRLLQQGSRHRFVDEATTYLDAAGEDPLIAALVAKTLMELGLGGPAREILQLRRELAAEDEATRPLREALRGVPTGRRGWEEFAEVFERNLAVLQGTRPDLAAAVADPTATRRSHQLFSTRDGVLQLSRRCAGGLRLWIPTLIDDPALTGLELPIEEGSTPATIIGLALDQLVEMCYDTTQRVQSGRVPLYILEPCLDRLIAWLHAGDRTRMLEDPRVLLFAGEQALDGYRRALAEHDDLSPADLLLSSRGLDLDCEPVREIGAEINEDRHQRWEAITVDLEGRSRQRRPADWAERLRSGGRVLGFASRFTTMLKHSMRDIGHAVERLGCEFHLAVEREPFTAFNNVTVARIIHEYDPDLIVLINHFRHEQARSFGGVPILTWIQDPTPLVLSRSTGASIGPLDFVCGYFREKCVGSWGYPGERFLSTPLPVSTRLFHDGPVDSADAAQYDCDIMYVGHCHGSEDELVAEWRAITPAGLHGLLDRIREAVPSLAEALSKPQAVRTLVRDLARDMKLELAEEPAEQFAMSYAYRLFDRGYRRETLTWVAEWARRTGRTFKLYGSGWEADPVLAPFAAGPIEHGEPLRRAYRCARLVLQTLPGGFKHQRAYEGIASGSLVITRYAPWMFAGLPPDEFDRVDPASLHPSTTALQFPGLARIVFRDAQELAVLADRFLDDEAYRREVHADLLEIIRRQYTYDAVFAQLIPWMIEQLDEVDS